MEGLAGTGRRGDRATGRHWQLAVVVGVVLLLRLPFLQQAVQGDDVYYLAEAEHAQIEPLHPNHFHYVFLGNPVDMRGHSHPPLDAWFLAGLLAAAGDIRETAFHAAYIVFSLIAALAMWSLARRFSPHPLWATLLFLVTPAFVINGNSFESDLPFLAFWMASVALFVSGRYLAAAGTLLLASLTAFQAVFLTPILALWVWLFDRKRRAAWMATLVPVATLAAWQVFERLTTGALPASVLAGYFHSYGFQALAQKLRSAAGLSVHPCWLVFPLLLPPGLALAWKRRDRKTTFLFGWILIFFAGALAVFFAGSARYLLPIVAPVALLVSGLRAAWLAAGVALEAAITVPLAVVNYQNWDGYRRFAASLPQAGRIWINGDWGLRYYLESEGGLPLRRGQSVRPGDLVVSSALSYPVEFTTGGGALTTVARAEIRPALPLRLIGLDASSGYSTTDKGFRPFDISSGPIDRLRADLVVERQPSLTYLPMNATEAEQQIASGIYALEAGRWRWMSGRAVILLKAPAAPARLRAVLNIPDAAPARRVEMLLDGERVAAQTFPGPGNYTLESGTLAVKGPSATVTIAIDKTFSVAGDSRQLGIILSAVGFE